MQFSSCIHINNGLLPRFSRRGVCRSPNGRKKGTVGAAESWSLSTRHDFYSILGVDPLATPSEIKESYRNMMKTCHPDTASSDDGDDLAVILNLIYDVLMDETQRSEYDILAGFAQTGKNPFDGCHSNGNRKRTEMAKYVFVDEYSCIGCYGCVGVASDLFHINDKDDYGRARCIKQNGNVDKVEMAMDVCPVSCIHWVSGAQLTILEEVMGKIGRVDSFLLMRSQGKGANLSVFYEAALEWARRQSRVRDMERRMAYNGIFSGEWMPSGPAGGATSSSSSSSSSSQQQRNMTQYSHITQIIDMTRSWREYSYNHQDEDDGGQPGSLKYLGDGS